MKKTFTYILAGVLTLLGFSSCASLRQARLERLERERQAEAERIARALEDVPPTLGVEKDEFGYPVVEDGTEEFDE